MLCAIIFSIFLLKCLCCNSIYKAHVINLPNRPERLQSITKQLQMYNIPFEVERAISPEDLDSEVKLRAMQSSSGLFDPKTELDFSNLSASKMRLAEIACSQSHLQVLFKIKNSNVDAPVLILEDDAYLEPDFYDKTVEILKEISQGSWDILHVGYCFESKQICIPGAEKRANFCKKRFVQVLTCLHAYFVNGSRTASLILNSVNTANPVILDQRLFRVTHDYYLSLPKLAKQLPFPSDNGNSIDHWNSGEL